MNMRRFLVNGMVAVAIMLFISMYFVGKRIEKPKIEKETVENSYTFSDENDQNSEDENRAPDYMDGREFEKHAEFSSEDVEKNIRPVSEAPPEELSYEMADLYDEATINASKETALKFVAAIFAFDGDRPRKHIEEAKPYMSEELIEQTSQFLGRATNEMYRAVITKTSISEAYDQQKGYFAWLVTIEGEFYSNENTLTSQVEYEYTVVLQEENNNIEVTHYELKKVNS